MDVLTSIDQPLDQPPTWSNYIHVSITVYIYNHVYTFIYIYTPIQTHIQTYIYYTYIDILWLVFPVHGWKHVEILPSSSPTREFPSRLILKLAVGTWSELVRSIAQNVGLNPSRQPLFGVVIHMIS